MRESDRARPRPQPPPETHGPKVGASTSRAGVRRRSASAAAPAPANGSQRRLGAANGAGAARRTAGESATRGGANGKADARKVREASAFQDANGASALGNGVPHGAANGAARGSDDAQAAANGAAEAHARDHRRFTRMWESHYELIRRYLLKRCPLEQSEDLVQETFLRVWESRQRPLDETRLPAYLLRVARNLWIDHLRWQKNWGNVVSLSDVVLADEHPERQLTANLRYDSVQAAVRTLSPRRRAVFELRWLKGCSHKEIAERLEITVKTVENHLNAAYRELRGLFPEEVANGTRAMNGNQPPCEEAG